MRVAVEKLMGVAALLLAGNAVISAIILGVIPLSLFVLADLCII